MPSRLNACGRFVFLSALVALFSILIPIVLQAEAPVRITRAIDDTTVERVPGSRHPLANAANDVGRVDGSLPMQRMLLLLQPSAEQASALAKLVTRQEDKDSPAYHHWLSPQEFGVQFGPAQQDLERISSWLRGQGFSVDSTAQGRQWIEFSGTAAQVERAFHTEMHRYVANGEMHVANATDISLPEALKPVVKGVLSLHDFQKRPMLSKTFKVQRDDETGKLVPDFTFSDSSGTFHFLTPGDFSRIYNTRPLVSNGIDGDGVSIGIVARSNVELSDVQTFRQIFGLPAKDPVFIVNGADPGEVFPDEIEAALDTQWSGAVAPQATINLVVTGSTFASDGSDLSLAYIVDHRVAPIVSSSFGLCEAFLGPAGNAFFQLNYEQAAAQGMTVFVSTGDNGAADCDEPADGRLAPALFGLNVSGLASTPFNIAVGGTEFAEKGDDSNFWLSGNRPDFSSAKGYIPEAVWNESCDPTVDPKQCGDNLYSLAAGSGGQSSCVNSQITATAIDCISGYPKPWWQVGSTVPDDHVRDLPDVSLTAASGHDGYLLCVEGTCQTATVNGNLVLENAFVVGGTSVSTPAMAGIMALVEQKHGMFQGLANSNFYQLAATETLSNCNSTLLTMPSQRPDCIFQDITKGNNSVPGQVGFNATKGFDLATGLGSVNAAKLVSSWKNGRKLSTQTMLSSAVTSVQHGQPFPLNVSVKPTSANGTPSGDFDLFVGSSSLFGGTLSGGSYSGAVSNLPGGQYELQAHYGGNPMFAPSDSNSITVAISPEPSAVTLTGFEINIGGFVAPLHSPVLYGEPVALQIKVAGESGVSSPTGTVMLLDNQNPLGIFQLDQGGNSFVQIDNLAATGLLVGHHTITATYSGDNSFLASRPARLGFAVDKVAPRGFIFPVPAMTVAGAKVRFLLSVLSPGQEIPTGTIQVFDNQQKLGSPLTLQNNGPHGPGIAQAEFTTSFTAGDHNIAFTYSGDKNHTAFGLNTFFAGHVDVPISAAAGAKTFIQVQQSPLAVSLSQTASYAVTVKPSSSGPVPTGSVSLLGPNGLVFAEPVPLVNGGATLPLTFDAAGDFEISANYSGDSHYSPFSSAIISTRVKKGTPTVTLQTDAAVVPSGSQTSFAVSVIGDPAVPAISIPFGFVQFFDSFDGSGGQPLGPPHFLIVGNGGNPVFSLPVVLPTGHHVIRAQYLGSGDWAPTFSNPLNVAVQP